MLLWAEARGEYKPIRSNTPQLGLAFQISNGGGVVSQQPKNAALDGGNQPHPDVEHLGHYLVGIVERAEDGPDRGQSGFAPRRRARCDAPLAVVRLIGVG